MRRFATRLLAFVAGLFFLLEFLLPAQAPRWLGGWDNPLTPYLEIVTNFLIVVGTMAFLLGPLNLVRSHLATIRRKAKERAESLAFLVCLVAGFIAAAQVEGAQTFFTRLYETLFYGVLVTFFREHVAPRVLPRLAAYRAFRLNSLDAGLMMASAAIVLLGQVPAGDWLTYMLPKSLHLRTWAEWLLTGPNAAVQRAVLIGTCGGAIATALRQWLGLGTRDM